MRDLEEVFEDSGSTDAKSLTYDPDFIVNLLEAEDKDFIITL